jgi:hypothetical protein
VRIRRQRDNPDEARAIARARVFLAGVTNTPRSAHKTISGTSDELSDELSREVTGGWGLSDVSNTFLVRIRLLVLIEQHARLFLLAAWILGGMFFTIKMCLELFAM